jgi:putative endonuclease
METGIAERSQNVLKKMNKERQYFVYILTNKTNNVLYVGVTNDLIRRIKEHKDKKIEGFTKKYNLTKLVYFEATKDVKAAISREKQIKRWRREKKESLINGINPEWRDLSDEWF